MPSHPRPQLTRPGWQDLCGTWEFAFDDAGVGLAEQWHGSAGAFDREIEVPFPFESKASGIAVRPGHRLLLHFGAVDYRAQVWVNGCAVAAHEGGSTPFTADITAALDPSGEQVIVVRAEDSPRDLRQPRGKQDWQETPHAIWYDRTSGIWQPVWLEEVPDNRIRALHWVPDVDTRSVELTVRVRADSVPGLRLRVVLRVGERLLADDTYRLERSEITRRIHLVEDGLSLNHGELMWAPEAPTLIDATLTLLDEDGAVLDEVGSYTALRSVSATRDRFLLNGRPYYLRLVLAQNFWPESHLAAPDDDAFAREVRLVKDLGFNGVRLHQKIEDPRFLAECDRQGLLVWGEMPAAYEFSTATIQRLTREWLEVLERDRSHPCVIAWVPINESWGVPAIERCAEQPVTDVVTVHDYTSKGSELRARYGDREKLAHTLAHTQPSYRVVLLPGLEHADIPVMITEFGGISFHAGNGSDGDGDAFRDGAWSGYGGVRTPEQLLEGYRDLVTALLDSPAVVGFCWTQLTDTQQEQNGLLTADRRPKVPLEQIRAVTAGVSAAVPGDAVGEFAYGDYSSGLPLR
jgi:beta-galactosidase/beta-glucuronidase